MKKLEGKIVAITGGTSGIGLESAKLFIEQGAKVALLARSQEKLNDAIAKIGGGTIGFVGDVTNLPSLKSFFSGTETELGKIDVLFANAGVTGFKMMEEVDEESFDDTVNVNFKGAYFTVKYASTHLNENSSVILTASCLDEMGASGLSVYSATKAAVRSLARTFTHELKKYGARINVLSPGPVATDIERKAGFSDEDVKAQHNYVSKALPVGRMGKVEEMASVALFLASDDSSFMYGSEIQVDGGMNQTRWQQ